MSWQKCPLCEGTGLEQLTGISSATTRQCTVCRGQKIIHDVNGKPPNSLGGEPNILGALGQQWDPAKPNTFPETQPPIQTQPPYNPQLEGPTPPGSPNWKPNMGTGCLR